MGYGYRNLGNLIALVMLKCGGLVTSRKIPVISTQYVNQSDEVNMNACSLWRGSYRQD